MNMIIYENSCG